MQTEIKNIGQLRENLLSNYTQLADKTITPKEAKVFSDISGKVMSSCKLEIAYAKHHNQLRKIEFLEQPIEEKKD